MISAAAAMAARIAASASGLSSSSAIVQRAAPQACSITCAPSTTSSARSRMRASSQQIHGSHSAPFSTRWVTARARPRASLAAVGKAAPPRPAMPALSQIARSARRAPGRRARGTVRSRDRGSSEPSFSMTMPGPACPASGPIDRTWPATGACRWVPGSSRGRAITSPSRTRAPALTQGTASRPSPWSSATAADCRGGGLCDRPRQCGVLVRLEREAGGRSRVAPAMFNRRSPSVVHGRRSRRPAAARCSRPGRAQGTARSRCSCAARTVCISRGAPTIASTGQAGRQRAHPMHCCSSIQATCGGLAWRRNAHRVAAARDRAARRSPVP